MDKEKQVVALYGRVSTDRQVKGLEAQRRALLAYCQAHGIQGHKLFEDFNVSGAKSSRPALDELMDLVDQGKISTIIVYSFSRFARSTKHLLEALELFRKQNITFVSLTEKIDTHSPIGKAVFTIISAIAQLERELIAERIKCGLENAKSKGKKLGRPKTRPSELIQTLLLQGCTYREIARLAQCSHGAISQEIEEFKRSENTPTALSEQLALVVNQ